MEFYFYFGGRFFYEYERYGARYWDGEWIKLTAKETAHLLHASKYQSSVSRTFVLAHEVPLCTLFEYGSFLVDKETRLARKKEVEKWLKKLG